MNSHGRGQEASTDAMSGVVAGVLIIGSLTNGMILMDVSEYTQMVVKGLVLAVAVGIDCMSKKKAS
jgi:ribose transport system permease protein